MNKNLLLLGGTVLVAGGLAYWYLSQTNGGGGVPPPDHECYGACYYKNQLDCDQHGNLCICRDGQWEFYKKNACTPGEYKQDCLPSFNDIATCIYTAGSGADKCDNLGFSTGCGCSPPELNCDVYHFCDARVHRCIENSPGLNISAYNNWERCFYTEKPYCSDCCDNATKSGQTCDFDLGGEWAASSLIGQITYEWTGFIGISTNIYGYLDGVGWSYLGNHHGVGEGPHELHISFAKQGLSKLRFAACSTYWVNSKPKSVYGTLV